MRITYVVYPEGHVTMEKENKMRERYLNISGRLECEIYQESKVLADKGI